LENGIEEKRDRPRGRASFLHPPEASVKKGGTKKSNEIGKGHGTERREKNGEDSRVKSLRKMGWGEIRRDGVNKIPFIVFCLPKELRGRKKGETVDRDLRESQG